MTDLRELVQDLLAHAHEAPATCAGLMRRAATELRKNSDMVVVRGEERALADFDPPGRPSCN